MDMDVDTTAFFSASSSLKKHCRKIESVTAFFIKRLSIARQSFDDVNYDRTVDSANAVKKEVYLFSQKVERLDSDLKKLESLVNEYAYGGYGSNG